MKKKKNIKHLVIGVLVVVVGLVVFLARPAGDMKVGEPENGVSVVNVIRVAVFENDIRVAEVVVESGRVEMRPTVEGLDLRELEAALGRIRAKKTLSLEVGRRNDAGDYILGQIQVGAGKMPDYGYAVQQELSRAGFYVEFFNK